LVGLYWNLGGIPPGYQYDLSLYRELYSINKKQLQERIYNKWRDYQIDILKELIKDIKDFIPTDSQTNSKGGFRKTKYSVSCSTFYKFKNINENGRSVWNEDHFEFLVASI